jgi:YcxB-like protein
MDGCIPREAVGLRLQHSLHDIIELNRTVREQRLRAWIIGILAVGLGAAGLWMAYRGDGPSPAPVFVAAALSAALAVGAPWLAGLGAWLLKTPKTPLEVYIDFNGVLFIEQDQRAIVRWGEFRRWFTTPNLLVLVGKQDALAIPRHCCNAAQWEVLERLVHQALGSSGRS